ncbi:DAHL domain-containing protein [Vacuolonema iberomarrocanum]|uniref:DAHL domain-containing protein n=1 Tax=Vacuolonema iberomarrocanum TaxID=3454632 RepID=UPI0019EF809F|nr:response regulator [filamentous cyanobacterium LEGE 07170]
MVWSIFQQRRPRRPPRADQMTNRPSPKVQQLMAVLNGYLLPTGAVLLLLLFWVKSQAVNLTQHNRYVDALRQLQELDARINQNLLQLRLGLLDYYDPIISEQAAIRELHQVLETPPDFVGATHQELQEQVQQNIQLWQEKDGLIQQFKSKNAILGNSLAYFPIAVTELTQQPDIPPDLATELDALLQTVLLFNLSASEELTSQVETNLEQLRSQASNSDAANEILANPLIHADLILENRLETDNLVETLLAIPTRQQGIELAETYDMAYQRAIRSANLYRLGLYAISTVFVITIAASIITKLRAATTALQQSETQLRHIFDNTQVGLFRTRLDDGTVIAANQYFATMLGYDALDDVVGVKQSTDLYADIQDRQKVLKTVLRTGKVRNFETQFRKQDGSLCWVLFSCQMNKAEDCLDKVVTDISDRKQAEAALRESEATKQALFQAIPDFMLRMYRHDSVFDVISPGKGIFFTDPNLKRANAEDFLPPVLMEHRLQAVQQALDTGEVQIYEQQLERLGHQVWEEVRIVPSGTDDVLVMIRDICDRKQAEAELKRATEAAQVANRAKSQFLSNMSHELRTPLNIILGFTQLMSRDRSLNTQQQSYLDSINQSGEHLLDLINDVLEMSKIEAGKISLNPGDFDLHSLLKGIHAMFQFKANSKGVDLRLEQASDLPQYVHTDESKLRQILVNLVGNAVKFTASGHICLRAAATATVDQPTDASIPPSTFMLQFEVEDTGAGIDADEIDTLFEPFVQAKTQQLSQAGTGLGLPISRKFAEMMGGEMTASSHLGQGSVFRFSIQAEPTQDAVLVRSQPDRPIIGLEPGQPTYRILIVEDVPENRRLLVDLLKPIGFELREAQNGQEALDIWQQWQPHLIWMDLRMPVMDGYEATKRIKAVGKQAPIVIVLTGSVFKQEQTLAAEAGCDGCVSKPFRTDAIFAKMAEFLGVRYTYGEPNMPATSVDGGSSAIASKPLTAQDLQIMPSEWIAQLNQAATRVDSQAVTDLIQEIPPDHGALASHLTQLVENFGFEEIVTLTKR